MPRLSLTARLTLLFTTASGAVLLLLGWVVLGAIERHFDDLDRSELTGKLQHAEHIIGAARTPQDLAGMVGQLREAFTVKRLFPGLVLQQGPALLQGACQQQAALPRCRAGR